MSDGIMDSIALNDQKIKPVMDGSTLIGGVYYMNYDECVIVSNDRWKDDAGGVPRHCFLLASAANWQDPDEFDENDAYAMLLRAEGPEKLPAEDELMQVRAEAMRKKVTDGSDTDPAAVPGSSEDVMDVLTRNEIQFSGIKAKILGTIYQEDNQIKFGSDVETFYSSARYEVYKPGPEALAKILSVQIPDEEDGIRVGRVRYSSTERRSDMDNATVPVNIEDITGNKTALFGMTRTGKSNTMKIIATAVFEHAVENDREIGQLLFDPAGEYANVNVQDEETALSELNEDSVTVYGWGVDPKDDDAESLQLNFFDYENIDAVWSTIRLHLTRNRDYVNSFKAANVVGPDNRHDNFSEYNRAMRRRSTLYACLLRADFIPDDDFSCPVPTNQDVLEIINDHITDDQLTSDDQGRVWLDATNLETFWDAVAQNDDEINDVAGDGKNPWIDTQLEAILTVFTQGSGSGYRILENIRRYHNPGTEGYYPEKIYEDLAAGNIVIVDLTTGTDEINQRISKTIVEYVINQAVERFTTGRDPHEIQVYVEEAHRLFGSDHLDDADVDDPYRRLAKEAAKYRIGLTYATQEVSEVDGAVLANTANWFVTHLNSQNETRELSKYYNFEDFERMTREAEDVGFARVQTLSGKFIVPAQIDLFDDSRIEDARDLYVRNRDEDQTLTDY
jgi:DNA helicase HerA-like ATPase